MKDFNCPVRCGICCVEIPVAPLSPAEVESGKYKTMEVSGDGKAVVEVVLIDQVAGAAHMEDHRDSRLLRLAPHRVKSDVGGRVTRGASRSHRMASSRV